MAKSVSFTGHRPNKMYGYDDHGAYQKLFDETILPLVENLIKVGYTNFYTGGAQGIDQLCFWAVHKLKKKYKNVTNNLYLPFIDMDNKWRGDGLFSRQDYAKMLRNADSIEFVTNKENEKNKSAYLHRNKELVCKADLLVAFLNSREEYSSGTSYTMNFASECFKPILHCYYRDDFLYFYHWFPSQLVVASGKTNKFDYERLNDSEPES